MKSVPIISTDKSICTAISSIIRNDTLLGYEPIVLTKKAEAISYLSIELPELSFINFSDKRFRPFSLLKTITDDPWLHFGGIIGVCKNYEEVEKIENIRGANMVVVLAVEEIEENLSKVLQIIHNNRRILFQQGIESDLIKNISGAFKIRNDPLEVKCYANLICNFLYNAKKIDIQNKLNLYIALNEILINAIEHGNCQINFNDKTMWLENKGNILDLIKKRCEDPKISQKVVTFEYSISSQSAYFLVSDEGDGFDWRSIKDPTLQDNILNLHGRGILMTKSVVENLQYNEKGNEVSFEIKFIQHLENPTPIMFEEIQMSEIKPGEVIFKEGEPGTFLYYIVKGIYDVIAAGRIVSQLTADDIFMGEMSFLLKNMRSATVVAKTPGKLIKISKNDFIHAIKQKPHYALFLCRLLAQRIQRVNQME